MNTKTLFLLATGATISCLSPRSAEARNLCALTVRAPELTTSEGVRLGCHDDSYYYYFMFEDRNYGYHMKERHWDQGWGYAGENYWSPWSGVCVLAERLWFLDALDDMPFFSGDLGYFVRGYSDGPKPDCDAPPSNREDEPVHLPTVESGWQVLPGVEANDERRPRLSTPFFDTSVVEGSSLLVHVAGHGEKNPHRHVETSGRLVDEGGYPGEGAYTKQVDFLLRIIDAFGDSFAYPAEERTHDGTTSDYGSNGGVEDGGEAIDLVTEYRARQAIALANDIFQNRFEERPLVRAEPHDIEALALSAGPIGLADPWEELEASDGRAVFQASVSDACGFTLLQGKMTEEGAFARFEPYEFEYRDTGNSASRNSLYTEPGADLSNEDNELRVAGRCFPGHQIVFEDTFVRDADGSDINRRIVGSDGEYLSTDEMTCFLTGIEGKLQGDHDRIGVYASDGVWWYRLANNDINASRRRMEAKITCIDAPLFETVRQNHNGVEYSTEFFSELEMSCALSDVNGRFRRDNNWVRVQYRDCYHPVVNPNADPDCRRWVLNVEENWTADHKISASMTCFLN